MYKIKWGEKAPGQKSVISPRSENYSGLRQYLDIYITLKNLTHV